MFAPVKLEIWNPKVAPPRKSLFAFRVSNLGRLYRIGGGFVGLAMTALGLGSSNVGFAQSCAMCYNTAASAKAAAVQALRSGVLILLIPPVLLVGAILARMLRSRERFDDLPEAGEGLQLSRWRASAPPNDTTASRSDGIRPAEARSIGAHHPSGGPCSK